ncbi:Uncharacterized protein Tcan_15698 [Toxocara canis]|uniref:Ig-like domain-containing protein n=1 Tax=Toxocara canis TaxID=6265 RepID=A0A0B2W3U9_TOXCA|nr:Uncharacterized protein Tcan_15698 [Toxocara canis]
MAGTVTTATQQFIDDASVSPTRNMCQVFGCVCEREHISCKHIAPSSLNQSIFKVFPNAKTITFNDCDEAEFHTGVLVKASQLEKISLRGCRVRSVIANVVLHNVRYLELSDNYLSEWTSICGFFNGTPALVSLDLSFNNLPSLESSASCLPGSLRSLNLSHNQISASDIPPRIEVLDLSANELSSVGNEWPASLQWINLSSNRLLQSIPPLSLPYLKYLNLDGCTISELRIIDCPRLRRLSLRNTAIEVIDFDRFNAPSLQELDLSESHLLSSIVGNPPANLRSFRISNSLLSYLPKSFFSSTKRLREVKLMPNAWNCNECLSGWLYELPEANRPQLNCSGTYSSDCSIGVPQSANGTRKIVRARNGKSAVLQCEAFGDPAPAIEWWLVRPERLIGTYEPRRKHIHMYWSRNDSYRIILGGNLIIQNADRRLVERYRCIASNEAGNASRIVHFRLDFSYWYSLDLYESVFWGSVVASLLLCATSFVLNILWITCRKTGLWWIRRAERLSRVRSMVEAVEKYRQKQMLNLHESYRTRIDHVRENYHQQMCRLRDYGSRRVEQLWESYERQMNRVRTFSLQQRLKLMRQYKVKQRYVNSLLEKFSRDDPAAAACLEQHSEAAVLGPIEELEVEGDLSRSSSYYSLPEYMIGDDGKMCCPSGADLSRMFNRHRQTSTDERRAENDQQQPSTSKQAGRVDQLRASYASQVERFRDYRAAQIETMGQHLDNIRDNYNQQMCRLRDYGSRRVEQLWESYERQMNRVRTFSLQQRLKLMRQYKVKQRYVNSLLEKFSRDDPAAAACLEQHSEAAVLGPIEELEVEGDLSRSSSYYSLPEYMIGDDGKMCCPSGADLSRMFNRHRQTSTDERRAENDQQQPSTSKQAGRYHAMEVIRPSSGQSLRRRLSLRNDSLSEFADVVTPSTSKEEDITQVTHV